MKAMHDQLARGARSIPIVMARVSGATTMTMTISVRSARERLFMAMCEAPAASPPPPQQARARLRPFAAVWQATHKATAASQQYGR